MKPKELLSKLSRVESLLNEFSFEELDTRTARALKQSFENFKSQLQETMEGNLTSAEQANDLHSSKLSDSPKSKDGEVKNPEGLLVANVSHELRTPLNGIIGFTDLLMEDNLNEVQQERVMAIQSASHSLMGIISELLEYSKLTAGLEKFENVDFNFYRLVRDVVYLCNTLIVQQKVALELVIDPAIPEVLKGDPAKLSQVLLNLLGNAIKFVDEGHIRLNILVKKKMSSKIHIEFTVRDNGIGIEEEQLPFIFDSFRQVSGNSTRTYGGVGLGLSIVKQIITHLDGEISVRSNLGQGTTFKFFLPFTKGDKTKLRKNHTAKQHYRDAAKLIKGSRILVFEDNPLNQRLIEERLKSWGCSVFVTDNGKYGIGLLEEQDIDIVLMDLRMPAMDGFEISGLIREHKSKTISQIPIIALTADFTVKDKEKSELNGINDYILKPYSPDELLLKLIANKNTMDTKMNLQEQTLTSFSIKTIESHAFSLDPIFEDCMGKMELLEELVRLYKQNILEFIGEVKHHLKQKDFDALDFSLHKISSALAQMQTTELQSIVVQMDNCCKSDRDLKHLNFLYDCFVTEYPNTQAAIDAELDRLKKK